MNFFSNQFSEERAAYKIHKQKAISIENLQLSMSISTFISSVHVKLFCRFDASSGLNSASSVAGVLSVTDLKFTIASKSYEFCKTGHAFR